LATITREISVFQPMALRNL